MKVYRNRAAAAAAALEHDLELMLEYARGVRDRAWENAKFYPEVDACEWQYHILKRCIPVRDAALKDVAAAPTWAVTYRTRAILAEFATIARKPS